MSAGIGMDPEVRVVYLDPQVGIGISAPEDVSNVSASDKIRKLLS